MIDMEMKSVFSIIIMIRLHNTNIELGVFIVFQTLSWASSLCSKHRAGRLHRLYRGLF